MFVIKTVKIRSYETGLYFRDGEFQGLLGKGRHWFADPLGKVQVDVVSLRAPWLVHDKLDVIVRSGALKDLMNKVTEAKKAAEANLIARREETAAMRNQANTARLLADNPTLMRLRELEVLEKIAGNTQLKVVLGEKGLADRVVNLL